MVLRFFTKKHWQLLPFLIILVGAIINLSSQIPLSLPQFASVHNLALAESQFFEQQLIPQPSYLLSAHSASIEALPDGRLIAVWFAGSHEGKPDVKIWQSYFNNHHWSDARAIVSPLSLTRSAKAFVKKVGNPVIYRAANGLLHLFVVSVSIGGWSGSSINHLVSYDNGLNWQNGVKLKLSPFFNVSTLLRTRAITLKDGGFYLPVYHESIRNYPELLRFNAKGDFVGQQRLNNRNHLMQPALIVESLLVASVYFRNHAKHPAPIFMQTSYDGGSRWGKVFATNLFNQDSSLATVSLGNGYSLMVHNPNERGRLVLAISHNGYRWRDIVTLESGDGSSEFSYPTVITDGNMVDIVYTWQRKFIKHVRFNMAWLLLQKHN